MNGAQLVLRPYQPGDEIGLVDLFNRVFRYRIEQSEWRWRLKTRPSSVETVFVATDGDKLIGQHAGISHRYHTPLGELEAIHCMGVMTDGDYRGQKLLLRGGQLAYETWASAQVPFVIGAPNPMWGKTAHKLGWRPFHPLVSLIRPLRLDHMLKERLDLPTDLPFAPLAGLHNRLMSRLVRGESGIELEPITVADSRFDELWLRVKRDFSLSLVRDAAWVNWRFLQAPKRLGYQVLAAKRRGALLGYAAYRLAEFEDGLYTFITELVTPRDEPAAARALVEQIARTAAAQGVIKLQAPVLQRSYQDYLFRRLGFWYPRDTLMIQFVQLHDDAKSICGSDPTQWLMTGGDFDVH